MNAVIPLAYSPLDSERFGRRIFRATFDRIDGGALREALNAHRVDTLVGRIDARHLADVAELHRHGLQPIVADTHVDYSVSLDNIRKVPKPGGIELIEVPADESERLRRVARTIFDGYSSHYAANPLLDRNAIADGYADWAARSTHSVATPTWFVTIDGTIAGFSIADIRDGKARGVLNGVLPDYRGRGVYRVMLNSMLAYFADTGARTFHIATQAQNVSVQRVWAESGLRIDDVQNTFHINCDH